ncbi:CoA-binding protein [Anatilimnocola floriformis]|uniref:CoA-binding protein n=1 Tax=Anatilimnocola floriformis TaxID=2948575 RepID=UPI0020C41116|nr:CoA-binding protein [Anatilimnocola floriformis]
MPTVAILGASTDRSKYGNKSVRAHQAKGFTVYPINPKADEIEGIKAFASIADVPAGTIDRVSVYLPPAIGMKVLPDIAARGCGELWLNPGSESDELVAEAERLGLNVVQACSIVDVGLSPRELP